MDLSVGTPVDPTPPIIQEALRAAANAPGYPTVHGTPAVRQAAADWMRRRLGVRVDPVDVLPLIGTKEFVAWLPTILGLSRADLVVLPDVAYPTYAVGAMMCQSPRLLMSRWGDQRPALVWLNTPSNPTGAVMTATHLRDVVDRARAIGAVVVSDECYIELAWDAEPVSVLHPDVCGGDHTGLLAVHSLSKRSNLAGYRFGFAAGDPRVIADLLAFRKHAGMMVPAPVQAAATVALADDEHVTRQREVYARRRRLLVDGLRAAGMRIDHSEAGLYVWATRGEDCWQTVDWLAERGILVAPGDFYGQAGAQHVRVALTGTDERIHAGVHRLRR